jgi:hypothetical protein
MTSSPQLGMKLVPSFAKRNQRMKEMRGGGLIIARLKHNWWIWPFIYMPVRARRLAYMAAVHARSSGSVTVPRLDCLQQSQPKIQDPFVL